MPQVLGMLVVVVLGILAMSGQGAGALRSFNTVVTLETTSEESANVSMGDLDGDAKIDVIAANRLGPSFVCLNQGGGHFASDCITIPAESATSIVPADFDKDGFIDLAVPSRDGGQSHIYFNDGKAGFARTAPFGPADAAARVGAAADFNGDGSLDLVMGDEKAASMVVYLNDGKGRLTAGFRIADKAKTPYAIAAGDLNNDRSPDIVLGYTSGPHSIFSTMEPDNSSPKSLSAIRKARHTTLHSAI